MAEAQTQATGTGTVVGYFDRYSDAQKAVSALQDAGFKASQIGLAARGSEDTGYSSSSTATGTTSGHTASGAAHKAGAKAEGVWDKVKNFFEGGAAEPYAEERREGDLATREITTNDYDDYTSDDFRGSLQGLSVPEEHSRYFGHRFENSQEGAVVTIAASGREAEAQRILQEFGADLGSNAANYDYAANTRTATDTGARSVEGQQRIQLLGEVLRVHKDRVQRGEVRVRKEVVTEQQTVQVPVTREELVVERVPVTGEQTATGQIGQDREIRIPLTEERAALDKNTVVREEVNVGKRTVENVRNLQGDTRREELVVNDESRANATGRVDEDVDDSNISGNRR